MHEFDQTQAFRQEGFEATKNVRGYMHMLNEISQAFIDFSSAAPGLVVDMGVAYGVATIPILKKHVVVTACDLEQEHLDELKKRIDPELLNYLKLQQGYFPNDFEFKVNSVGAILLSHILHFLSPDEIDCALDKLSQWIAVDGKIFIVNYSPYVLALKEFIPIYEERLAQGIKWPYWVENNMRDYFSGPTEVIGQLPATMNYLDLPLIKKELEMRNFIIEKAAYLDAEKNHIPPGILLDGREWVGIIARKA